MDDTKGDEVEQSEQGLTTKYFRSTTELLSKLNSVSSSFCLAKWYNVSIHIPTGHTHSCYHPRSHKIPIEEVKIDVSALHNTNYKKAQRKLMLEGTRPTECNFCWEIEDSGNQLSDRAYRSQDIYREGLIEEAKTNLDPNPRYLEVNFNQACNFKCTYCSPHLSTAWQQDIERNGPFVLQDRWHNDMTWVKQLNIDNGPDNPYLKAFWEWFPKVYPTLQTFRMTGGEPLMDKNTFKVFDYIKNNPKRDLHLSITSNCCPPGDQWKKFMDSLQEVTDINAIDHFMLFCSLDSWEKQAEYIRFGMNFAQLKNNITDYLANGKKHSLTFIITFNVLSYTKFFDYMRNILILRKKYNTDRQLIWFDVPQLSSPEWMNPKMLPELSKELKNTIKYMEIFKEGSHNRYKGFKDFEISKVKRLYDWINMPCEFDRDLQMKNFYLYFSEHDRRRGTNFLDCFSELTNFWNQCKAKNGS